MLKLVVFACRQLWREWRAGEWFIVCMALFLAVAATTSIHFYTDRIQRGIDRESARFLGGDLVISSSTSLPADWEEKAHTFNLRTAQVWSYPSVVSANNHLQLVNIQAVSDQYPILDHQVLGLKPGSIWVESRLLPILTVKPGEKINIGAAEFKIEKELTGDVDALTTGWTIAPRVMMRLDDVPQTRTVVPGSRVDYRLLMTGEPSDLKQFREWITPHLKPGQLLLDVHNQRFPLSDILARTQNFLLFILLTCVLMSGVAIALSIQQYLRRHYSHIALWRCLGGRENEITCILTLQLLMIAILTGIAAIGAGYIAQNIFVKLFQSFIQFSLPTAGAAPVILGFAMSILILFAFSFPVIIQLPRTSPLYLWRGEIIANTIPYYLIFILILLCAMIVTALAMNDFRLVVYYFTGYLLAICLMYAFAQLLIWLIGKTLPFLDGTLRSGLNQLLHHRRSFMLQFMGLSLILMSLYTSSIIKTDMIQNWRSTLPTSAPNYFAFNIGKSDIVALDAYFDKYQIPVAGMYPMVRGRLVAVNGQPVLKAVPPDAVNHNALHRDLNLSWMWQYPSDNRIVKGKAWTLQAYAQPIVSVENNLADALGFHLNDELTLQVGDKQIKASIVNFRSVVWSSIHPNFFMIFPPGLLKDFPATYITSFHLTSNQTAFLNDITKLFPNITIIDMASLLIQIQELLSKIISAVQYLFLFALALGILIFITSLQSSMDERRQTYSLMRILGAEKKYIIKCLMVEFTALTFLILVTSFTFSLAIVQVFETIFFNF